MYLYTFSLVVYAVGNWLVIVGKLDTGLGCRETPPKCREPDQAEEGKSRSSMLLILPELTRTAIGPIRSSRPHDPRRRDGTQG